jgi:hypothetical protein
LAFTFQVNKSEVEFSDAATHVAVPDIQPGFYAHAVLLLGMGEKAVVKVTVSLSV